MPKIWNNKRPKYTGLRAGSAPTKTPILIPSAARHTLLHVLSALEAASKLERARSCGFDVRETSAIEAQARAAHARAIRSPLYALTAAAVADARAQGRPLAFA